MIFIYHYPYYHYKKGKNIDITTQLDFVAYITCFSSFQFSALVKI